MKTKLFLRILLCMLSINAFPVMAKVVTYPAPEGESLSNDYTLEVNGKPVDIYLAKVTEVKEPPAWALKPGDLGSPYSFAYFDFSGSVTVKITSLRKPLDKLVILPLSHGIKPVIKGNTATFTLKKPCKFSFEPTGRFEPLLVFANPLETDIPKEGDPNVIYFGPGMHKPVKINVTSGQTVYIAGGAVVKGGISADGIRDVTIRGRGILCGDDWPWQSKGMGFMITLHNTRNALVEGIILRGPWSWTISPQGCDTVLFSNVKICGDKNPNDDGMDIDNSRNVTVRDCFFRTDDDCFALMGLRGTGNGEYNTIEDCILWCDRARIFLVGHFSRTQYMRHIVIRNIDIIHFSMTPFLFEPGEDMTIDDFLVENVRINAEKWGAPLQIYKEVIALRPVVNQYMQKKVPGRINNLIFRNITMTGDLEDSERNRIVIRGADPDHMVTNVTFENITWFGQSINENSPQVQIGEHTSNIRFIASGANP